MGEVICQLANVSSVPSFPSAASTRHRWLGSAPTKYRIGRGARLRCASIADWVHPPCQEGGRRAPRRTLPGRPPRNRRTFFDFLMGYEVDRDLGRRSSQDTKMTPTGMHIGHRGPLKNAGEGVSYITLWIRNPSDHDAESHLVSCVARVLFVSCRLSMVQAITGRPHEWCWIGAHGTKNAYLVIAVAEQPTLGGK